MLDRPGSIPLKDPRKIQLDHTRRVSKNLKQVLGYIEELQAEIGDAGRPRLPASAELWTQRTNALRMRIEDLLEMIDAFRIELETSNQHE